MYFCSDVVGKVFPCTFIDGSHTLNTNRNGKANSTSRKLLENDKFRCNVASSKILFLVLLKNTNFQFGQKVLLQ